MKHGKGKISIDLIEDDLVFITNGCCTDTSCYGDQTHAPDLSGIENGKGDSWDMWKAIAAQAEHGEYGNPDKFCSDVDATNWMSATVATSNEEIIQHIMNVCKRDPRSGKVTTGGIVTVKDSNWLMSWTLNRQPQFKKQPGNELVVWIYGLFSNRPGDYVKKPMKDCTGIEIAEEWLYHIGVPLAEIHDMAVNSANTVPCMMPYVMSYFMPRALGDRPAVVPEGSVNLAFIGNFAETPRDTVFTTEYSVRTAMEAVYTLLGVDRGVPEVFASCYDVRMLMNSASRLMDGKKLADIKVPFIVRQLEKKAVEKSRGTIIHELLEQYGLI